MRKLKTRLFTGLLAVMLCCTALTLSLIHI